MLPEGYALLNRAILATMRREWNDTATGADWKMLRVRAGVRALAAVVSYGVDYNQTLWGQLQREGVWIDGHPYDVLRRPYFKASPVILDRAMHPLDFVVERG